MMELELLKLIPGGSGPVIICLVVVVLFLRFIKEMHDSYTTRTEKVLGDMSTKHDEMLTKTCDAFHDQTVQLTDKVFVAIEQTTTAVKENAVAMKGLEGAVRDLQSKIK